MKNTLDIRFNNSRHCIWNFYMNTSELKARFNPQWSNEGKNSAVKLLTLLLAVLYYRGSAGLWERKSWYVLIASLQHLMDFHMKSPAPTPISSNNSPTVQLQRGCSESPQKKLGSTETLMTTRLSSWTAGGAKQSRCWGVSEVSIRSTEIYLAELFKNLNWAGLFNQTLFTALKKLSLEDKSFLCKIYL